MTELSGNILFGVRTSTAAPVLVLPAGMDTAAVQVHVTATRCDAHALTESKTSFTFPLFVTVGADEPAAVSMTVSATGRRVLQGLLEQTCDAG